MNKAYVFFTACLHVTLLISISVLSSSIIPVKAAVLPGLAPNIANFSRNDVVIGADATGIITGFGRNSDWKYYAQNTDLLSLPTPHYATAYNDSAWAAGNGILGFGETYLATTLPNHGGYTYYFRKTFTISEDPAAITSLTLEATYDDGFVAYINGQEVARRSMPAGPYTYTTAGVNHESGQIYETIDLTAQIGRLVQGTNVIAVDVHQINLTSTDIVWDAALSYQTGQPSPTNTPTNTPTLTPTTTLTDTSATSTTPPSPTSSYSPTYNPTGTPSSTPTPTPSQTPTPTSTTTLNPDAFSFVSMGDGQALAAPFALTVNQIATLHPELAIFNGDLEINGVAVSEMDPMITDLKNAGLFNQTFLARGNHDNAVGGSAALWESYFETAPNIKVLPAGVTDYVSLDASSDYLNYSFIYENSMFIGMDIPGDAINLITSTQLTFLDSRLAYAESKGLVHAFIYFHGPLYCVEGVHCTCTTRTDAACTPSGLIPVLNKHPIVSATFHGHEHILGWTHMDNSRLAGLTGSFEQFITSPSGGTTYNASLFPARMDYTYLDMGSSQGFASIAVNGYSFTFNIYKVGTTAPVWSKTFTKGIPPTPTATETATSTLTPTNTPSPISTNTPTFSATYTANPACYVLTLSHTGQGSDPAASPTNSAGCSSGQYAAGQAIQLSSAVPASGWQIGSWTGTANDSSMAGINSLTMPAGVQSIKVNYGQVAIGNWLSIFQGIEEAAGQTTVTTGSGNQVIHALRIDLQNPNIHLLTTQPINNNYLAESRETAGLKTSEFLVANGLQVAINANFFSPCCSQPSGSPMDLEGLAISNGSLVSSQEDADFPAAMLFSSANVPSMIPVNWPAAGTDGVANAVTGKYALVVNGTNVASNGAIHPRTAIGYSADKRYLILITIDGRQPGYSDGAEDINTAEWMIRLGAYQAINLDGGGSTTMVVSDGQGGATLVNRPIHNNVPGLERVVANHLGVYALPLCYALNLGHTGQGSNPAASPANSTGCPSGQYVAGQAIQLSGAVPVSDWHIGSWTGTADDSSTAGTNSLTMPAAARSVGVNYVVTPATSTNTPTATATNTFTPTATFTFTPTKTATATYTPTATNTFTPSSTLSPTFTATLTATNTLPPTATFTFTPTKTNTSTFILTETNTLVPTNTITPTFTATYTATNTPTATFTFTPTKTNTATSTPTETNTLVPTSTNTPTFTATYTATNSPTATLTFTSTKTATSTSTPTATKTSTPTSTRTPSPTPSPMVTPTPAYPQAGILDNFNRSNGAIGASWGGSTAGYKIASNQLGLSTGGYIFWKTVSFGPNQEAFIKFVTINNKASTMNLELKSQNNSSLVALLEIRYNPSNKTIAVYTFTTAQGWVRRGTNVRATFINGDQLGARATAAGKVNVYKNGVLLTTVDITAWPYYASGGYIGLEVLGSTAVILDDFGGGP
jgi:exopolysaccharide biosynthesis protein